VFLSGLPFVHRIFRSAGALRRLFSRIDARIATVSDCLPLPDDLSFLHERIVKVKIEEISLFLGVIYDDSIAGFRRNASFQK